MGRDNRRRQADAREEVLGPGASSVYGENLADLGTYALDRIEADAGVLGQKGDVPTTKAGHIGPAAEVEAALVVSPAPEERARSVDTGRGQAEQGAEQHALPGPRGTDEAEDLAVVHA
jgi:hypothetical protein